MDQKLIYECRKKAIEKNGNDNDETIFHKTKDLYGKIVFSAMNNGDYGLVREIQENENKQKETG